MADVGRLRIKWYIVGMKYILKRRRTDNNEIEAFGSIELEYDAQERQVLEYENKTYGVLAIGNSEGGKYLVVRDMNPSN